MSIQSRWGYKWNNASLISSRYVEPPLGPIPKLGVIVTDLDTSAWFEWAVDLPRVFQYWCWWIWILGCDLESNLRTAYAVQQCYLFGNYSEDGSLACDHAGVINGITRRLSRLGMSTRPWVTSPSLGDNTSALRVSSRPTLSFAISILLDSSYGVHWEWDRQNTPSSFLPITCLPPIVAPVIHRNTFIFFFPLSVQSVPISLRRAYSSSTPSLTESVQRVQVLDKWFSL